MFPMIQSEPTTTKNTIRIPKARASALLPGRECEVFYWRERSVEVDFVIRGLDRRIVAA
jgi:hypothetical protein